MSPVNATAPYDKFDYAHCCYMPNLSGVDGKTTDPSVPWHWLTKYEDRDQKKPNGDFYTWKQLARRKLLNSKVELVNDDDQPIHSFPTARKNMKDAADQYSIGRRLLVSTLLLSVKSQDKNYDGRTVINKWNMEKFSNPVIILEGYPLWMKEGETIQKYGIVLKRPPQKNVTVICSTTGDIKLYQGQDKRTAVRELRVDFTKDDWYVQQLINVSPDDDNMFENDHIAVIHHETRSSDYFYSPFTVDVDAISMNITDRDAFIFDFGVGSVNDELKHYDDAINSNIFDVSDEEKINALDRSNARALLRPRDTPGKPIEDWKVGNVTDYNPIEEKVKQKRRRLFDPYKSYGNFTLFDTCINCIKYGSNVIHETIVNNVIDWIPSKPISPYAKHSSYLQNVWRLIHSLAVGMRSILSTGHETKVNYIVKTEENIGIGNVNEQQRRRLDLSLQWKNLPRLNRVGVRSFPIAKRGCELRISEGSQGIQYSLRLNSKPSAPVNVTVEGHNCEGYLRLNEDKTLYVRKSWLADEMGSFKHTLLFNETNWANPQMILLSVLQDMQYHKTIHCYVSHVATSDDLHFHTSKTSSKLLDFNHLDPTMETCLNTPGTNNTGHDPLAAMTGVTPSGAVYFEPEISYVAFGGFIGIQITDDDPEWMSQDILRIIALVLSVKVLHSLGRSCYYAMLANPAARPTGDSVEVFWTLQFMVLVGKLPYFDRYLEIYHTLMSCLEWQILSIGDVAFEREGWESYIKTMTGGEIDIKQAEPIFVGANIILLFAVARISYWVYLSRQLHAATPIKEMSGGLAAMTGKTKLKEEWECTFSY